MLEIKEIFSIEKSKNMMIYYFNCSPSTSLI